MHCSSDELNKKLQIQQKNAMNFGRLAVGPRQIDYMSKTRPRTPRV
jgi:hypothetical protein